MKSFPRNLCKFTRESTHIMSILIGLFILVDVIGSELIHYQTPHFCIFKMAAVSAFTAFSSFSEKSSNNQENWQDANAALLELDKGD